MIEIIEGIVEHECGWVSDGGAFPEGAGCPKCGERIVTHSIHSVGRRRREKSHVPINLTNPDNLARLTVSEIAAFIEKLPVGPELAEIELVEQAGENRKGVIAAIRARIAEEE